MGFVRSDKKSVDQQNFIFTTFGAFKTLNMSAYYDYLNRFINKNHRDFKDHSRINWLNPYKADTYENIRDEYLSNFSTDVIWSYKGTKPWINSLSKGCELCGSGEWSCLFLTGRCNAKCFYCPSPQNSDDTPTAQQLEFISAENYADYINFFDFKGISFSGGEPFLVYERLIEFLSTIRKKCRPDIYTWMYTNGILSTTQRFKELADYGLDEVRFDIGATSYLTEHIKKAKGIIGQITVEIPMDPDKTEFIKNLVPELLDSGVTNLNLHQLRLTKHNAPNLLKRDFTFLHGEHPTVLESELAVLELIDFIDKTKTGLGVNYCSFQYKNRFQKAGYRRKINEKLNSGELLTENGYIIEFFAAQEEIFPEEQGSSVLIKKMVDEGILIKISMEELLKNSKQYSVLIIDFTGYLIESSNLKNNQNYQTIGNCNYFIEKGKPTAPFVIRKSQIEKLVDIFRHHNSRLIPEEQPFFDIWRHLFIETGLRQYF